jgi:hypothetical protein
MRASNCECSPYNLIKVGKEQRSSYKDSKFRVKHDAHCRPRVHLILSDDVPERGVGDGAVSFNLNELRTAINHTKHHSVFIMSTPYIDLGTDSRLFRKNILNAS